MEHQTHFSVITGFQGVLKELYGCRHCLQGFYIPSAFRFFLLVDKDGGCFALNASIKEEQVVLQLKTTFVIEENGLLHDRAVAFELQYVQTAEGRGVLVLFADGLADKIYLKATRRFRAGGRTELFP